MVLHKLQIHDTIDFIFAESFFQSRAGHGTEFHKSLIMILGHNGLSDRGHDWSWARG